MENLRILTLKVNNFKGIIAATIDAADQDVVVLTGKNGSGKTSALDAIFATLQWAAASKNIAQPIHAGAETASATVSLGKYTVTRKWAGKAGGETTTSLEVRDAANNKLSPPQKILDELIGDLSFDPMQFSRLKPADQRDALLSAFGMADKVAELDQQRRGAFDDRTAANRRVKEKQAQIAGIAAPAPDAPRIETPISEVLAELRAAQERNDNWDKLAGKHNLAEREFCDAHERLLSAQSKYTEALKAKDVAYLAFDAAPERIDLSAIQARADSLEMANRKAREAVQYDQLQYDAGQISLGIANMEQQMADVDAQKAALLQALPLGIPDVAVSDAGITIKGVAFSDCCTAEKWGLSIAVAMAANPHLRVIRVSDGSLLDKDTLAELRKVAKEKEYQVWIETVDGSGANSIKFVEGKVEVADDAEPF